MKRYQSADYVLSCKIANIGSKAVRNHQNKKDRKSFLYVKYVDALANYYQKLIHLMLELSHHVLVEDQAMREPLKIFTFKRTN